MSDYVGLLRRRGHFFGLILPAALLLGILTAYLLPATYRATGVLMAEGAAISADLVRNTTPGEERDVTLDSAQRIELLRRKVMKGQALLDLVKKVDPRPDQPGLTPEERAGEIVAATSLEPVNPVTFERARGSTAFAVHYENRDPKVAGAVGSALLALFVEYNSRVRTEQASEATKFLREQAQALEKDLSQAERKLADFKARYGEALPNSEGRNMMGADRARRDLEEVQRKIVTAEEREGLLRVQLGEISPTLSSAVGNWRTEIAKLKGELALAQQKYTPDHPDVRRLQRAIADLAAKGGMSDTELVTSADNPEYLRVVSQLQSARRELGVLRASEARIRGELYGYEQNLATAPNVEREYVQLSRQYDAMQAQYNDLQQKIKTASLTESLESQSKGERFEIIRDVSVPATPYSPNRIGIVFVTLLLGAVVALLGAVISDGADPTVRSQRDVDSVFGTDPIAMIPVLHSHADFAARKRRVGRVAVIYAAAAGLAALAILVVRY